MGEIVIFYGTCSYCASEIKLEVEVSDTYDPTGKTASGIAEPPERTFIPPDSARLNCPICSTTLTLSTRAT